MSIYAGYSALPKAAQGFSIAMGNFDGIHAGHLAVIDAARHPTAPLGVATFEPPPRAFFRPNDPSSRIMRPARRNKKILANGVEAVFELPFNRDMAGMTDEEFAGRVLRDGLKVTQVSIGFDFRFGQGRMGDATRLASLGRAFGFDVNIVEPVNADGQKASSTAIRNALLAGQPERAAKLLGHDWVVDGIIEHGEKRGRTIGFPTANIHLGDLIAPHEGVYAVRARIEGKGDWLPGVANYGRTPTTGLRAPLLETFIFDFNRDIYGKSVEIAFVRYLRPELNFGGIDEMVAQMDKDVLAARETLGV